MTASCVARRSDGLSDQSAFGVAQDGVIASYDASRFPLGSTPSTPEDDSTPFALSVRAFRSAAALWQNPGCISAENNVLNELLHDISRPLDWASASDMPSESNYEPGELAYLPMCHMLASAQVSAGVIPQRKEQWTGGERHGCMKASRPSP